MIDQETADRFWARVDTSGGPGACWEWQGLRDRQGYGMTMLRGYAGAHVLAYVFTYGFVQISRVQVIRHRCANPPCCNPSHLLHGTQQENMRDIHARRRHNIPPGALFTYEDEAQP